MKIYSQTPTRISLAGGGTDVGEYAEKYGGVCLNMAINIHQHITIETNAIPNTLPQWTYPEGGNKDFYRSFLDGLEPWRLNASFDGPIESGLGSSAAAAVSLVGIMDKIKNTNLSREQIAEKAWDIEVNKLGLFGGKQDQYCSVYGGINAMNFKDGKVEVIQLSQSYISKLFPCLCLFYLGKNRKSPDIQNGLRIISDKQRESLDNIKRLTLDIISLIGEGDIDGVGRIFSELWENKKSSNKNVSNSQIEEVYSKALTLGALSGKVLGAGGGGHMLFIVSPDKRQNLIDNLGIEWVDFGIDWNGLGVRRIS